MVDEIWQFPKVKYTSGSTLSRADDKEEAELNLKKMQLELAKLKEIYLQKNMMMEKIITAINQSEQYLSNDVADLMLEITKKCIKHLIYQEIKTDPSVLIGMIDHIKSIIESNPIISIAISANDYSLLDDNHLLHSSFIKDETLNSGDVVVKSNVSKVNAILTNRIESLVS